MSWFESRTAFDYDRLVIGFHGTCRTASVKLVDGVPFAPSENDDDWLGHGIYFWEYAHQRAWRWAIDKYGDSAAVVGALIRLGCIDFLDPDNVELLATANDDLERMLSAVGQQLRGNANNHKFRDCALINYLCETLARDNSETDSVRSVFVPHKNSKLQRIWPRSGIFRDSHIQIAVRDPSNILAVWPMRKDGHYGRDQK